MEWWHELDFTTVSTRTLPLIQACPKCIYQEVPKSIPCQVGMKQCRLCWRTSLLVRIFTCTHLHFYCRRITIGVPGLVDWVTNYFYCRRMTICVPGLVSNIIRSWIIHLHFNCRRITSGVPGLGVDWVTNYFYCRRMTICVPGLVSNIWSWIILLRQVNDWCTGTTPIVPELPSLPHHNFFFCVRFLFSGGGWENYDT